MAKNYKDFDDSEGVWRTVGGRRIFIRNGQDLASAMKESGKFKKKKNLSEDEKAELMNETMDKRQKIIEKLDEETKDLEDYDKYNLAISKLEQQQDEMTPTERQYWVGTKQRYVEEQKAKEKEDVDKEYIKKVASAKNDNELKEADKYYKEKTGKEWNALTDRDAKDVLKALNDEGSDFTFNDDVKIEDGKIKTSVGVFMPDERGYVERDLEIPVGKDETYESLELKIRDWQYQHSTPDTFENPDFKQTTSEYMNDKIKDMYKKDNLPRKTEIKTQGTSNRKEVSENIQAHILEYYDKPEDFIEQMDAMDYLPTKWRAGEELAKGGSYLIYNGDMSDFLNELKINPKGKSFSEDKAFNMYTSLIGRESAKLYDRLKKNAYNKYLKEHPNSEMTFEEFKDMRKQ